MALQTYERYSVSEDIPTWVKVGERNELILNLKDNLRGTGGTVVKSTWKSGKETFEFAGTGHWLGARAGGPMWGEQPTFIHTYRISTP